MHCHQTCTECQPSWQAAVLKFIEGENTNSTNSTGGNEEDINSKSHTWEEKNKENTDDQVDDPEGKENSEKSNEDTEEQVDDPEGKENSEKSNEDTNEQVDDPEGKENSEKSNEDTNEQVDDPEEEDSEEDKKLCEDSNDLCKTPKLLATFLGISLKEDQDPCEQTTIQVMCRSTCKKCVDPNAEVPSLEKYKEMQKSIGDIWGKLVASFSDFFRKFFV